MIPSSGSSAKLVIARNFAAFLTIVFLVVFLMMLVNNESTGSLIRTGIAAAGSLIAFIALSLSTRFTSLEEVAPPSPSPSVAPPSPAPRPPPPRRDPTPRDSPPPDYQAAVAAPGPPPSYNQAVGDCGQTDKLGAGGGPPSPLQSDGPPGD